MNDLNYEIFFYLTKTLGIKTKIVRGSEMNLRGEATERLLGICKDLGAGAYLTGAYAAEVYLEKKLFDQERIRVSFQEFECPLYHQLYPAQGFIPELSVVDLIFNEGPKSLEILMNGHVCPQKESE